MIDYNFLQSVDLFHGLSNNQIALFESAIEHKLFPKGATIFKENDNDANLYIVKSGEVSNSFSLEVNTGEIHPIILKTKQSESFGEFAFADSLLRTATAVTDSETELIIITKDRFYEIAENNTEVGYLVMKNLLTLLSSRIRRMDNQLKIALKMGWNSYEFDKY